MCSGVCHERLFVMLRKEPFGVIEATILQEVESELGYLHPWESVALPEVDYILIDVAKILGDDC